MPILDFKEIPEAHKATGMQDTFELFARDFLLFMGYKIITDPDRGADGGVDLLVEEKRTGVGGETIIRWLVSCKHKAHSGSSVKPTDDSNISDRVSANKCQGFLGFYSTLSSTGLSGNLEGMRTKIEYQIFDREKIEKQLLHSTKGLEIAERYFPISLANWRVEYPTPAKIFSENPSLKCKVCNKELLEEKDRGVIQLWQHLRQNYKEEPEHFEYVYWTCRGHCDSALEKHILSQTNKLVDGWEDIDDVVMPQVFIKWIITILNELRDGTIYSDEAFSQLKKFILNVYPYVCRHPTENEKERVQSLLSIPSYLGGLG